MAAIVFLSHTARASTFRVGSHHLSRELVLAGHEVAHVSTPYSLLHRLLRPGQSARGEAARAGVVETEGVRDLVPRPLLPANLRWSRSSTQKALREVGIPAPDYVFIDQPLFPARHFPASTVVFRPTDIFSSRSLHRAALALLDASQGVAATSPGVLESVAGTFGGATRVIENGVEFSRFSRVSGEVKEYDFVYVGALDPRFDFAELASAASALPHASFAIFGPVPEGIPSLPSNVQLRGAIDYASVPEAMARGRWGVMPFVANASNAARSPMKLYEYVAAGLPVIAPHETASRAPALAGLNPYDARTPGDFARTLSAVMDTKAELPAADIDIARSRDWSNVARELLEFAEECARQRPM